MSAVDLEMSDQEYLDMAFTVPAELVDQLGQQVEAVSSLVDLHNIMGLTRRDFQPGLKNQVLSARLSGDTKLIEEAFDAAQRSGQNRVLRAAARTAIGQLSQERPPEVWSARDWNGYPRI
jgi:hypothetical protein